MHIHSAYIHTHTHKCMHICMCAHTYKRKIKNKLQLDVANCPTFFRLGAHLNSLFWSLPSSHHLEPHRVKTPVSQHGLWRNHSSSDL